MYGNKRLMAYMLISRDIEPDIITALPYIHSVFLCFYCMIWSGDDVILVTNKKSCRIFVLFNENQLQINFSFSSFYWHVPCGGLKVVAAISHSILNSWVKICKSILFQLHKDAKMHVDECWQWMLQRYIYHFSS
jgi:hypothetical protein